MRTRAIFFVLMAMAPLAVGKCAAAAAETETTSAVASPATPDKPGAPAAEMEMVAVPAGCFQMGDVFGDGKQDEKPVHEVCLDAFAIGKYEVTQGQWQALMGGNPAEFKRGDDYPVENVSWNDIQDFIRKLNRLSGKHYRLPTEAEWEYAARSGGKPEKYAGGDDAGGLAWFEGNAQGQTHPVGSKRANGLGIHDMSGNVWEWCQDLYNPDYYVTGGGRNPLGPLSGVYRVFRGGAWEYGQKEMRTSYRGGYFPNIHDHSIGFRLALSLR